MRRRHQLVWSALVLVIATVIVVSACAPPAPPAAKEAKPAAGATAVPGDAENGKQLFAAKGCIACHVAQGVPGATGTIGPNLNGIGDPSKRPQLADGATNTPEHIREWIIDPQKAKPGTMMPNLGLSAKEADDLTAFLVTLTR